MKTLSEINEQLKQGNMRRATEADRGIVERPVLAPHLSVQSAEKEALLLVSESSNHVLIGRLYNDLIPLLDGSRSRQETVSELADRYSYLQVTSALVSLARNGHVVSGEFSMDGRLAGLWCRMGATPRWAETRLKAAGVSVSGGNGTFEKALKEMGISVTSSARPDISVTVTDNYLDSSHAEANRKNLKQGIPWMLVKPFGSFPLFGPVFKTDHKYKNRFCWECLSQRLAGNLEVESYLRQTEGRAAPSAPLPDCYADAVAGIAAFELAKWIVFDEMAALDGNVVSMATSTPHTQLHPVTRRPQCAVCGDPALYRRDRPPLPVVLESSPKLVRESGGFRSVPPSETLRRYRHLVSPVSGVVNSLVRTSDDKETWMHVYAAGSNLALKAHTLFHLRNSLRSRSSGKGSTRDQAEASALCEAVERYSGAYQGDEIRRCASFDDFADGEAIDPRDVMNFSDWQYRNAEELNARGHRFAFIPKRFDPAVKMSWSPVWSLTRKRNRYLPTAMLYFSMPKDYGNIYCGPDSNGCASGNTKEEAILQGFFELVERDAFACWWYNRIRLPAFDIDSLGDPYLSKAAEFYAGHNRDFWLIDLTHDMDIPVIAAVSRRTDKEQEDIIFSAGAHFDPYIAAMRAVCELNQYAAAVLDADADGGGYYFDDPESLWWWKNAKLADNLYLSPSPSMPAKTADDYTVPATSDTREDVELCRSVVEARGMEFLVLDQTRPDVRMPVMRTIVPGMRHFWTRFAPGRLYDVPVAMGWLDSPIAEEDLNPVPVFI